MGKGVTRQLFTLLLTAAIIMPLANCTGTGNGHGPGNNPPARVKHPSASDIAQAWLEVKTTLNPDAGARIEAFIDTAGRFTDSPVGRLFWSRRHKEMASLGITHAAAGLKSALHNNDVEAARAHMLAIDKSVTMLQRIDSELSGASQMNYFLLFFFFSLLVISVILVLTALRSRLEKEMTLHQQSAAFSRKTILAQEQERERIARELHDTVAQDLLRLSFQTETIDKTLDPDLRGRLCAEVVSGQKEIMGRIRNICENLIPPDFQRRRLGDALQTLCHKFEQRAGIACQFTIEDDAPFDALDSEKQLHCFRIVQESLANIEKHAEADKVSVAAGGVKRHGAAAHELCIRVSDNGKGIQPRRKTIDRDICRNLPGQGHFGLWNMFERAESLNAALEIDSGGREGTTVTIRMPTGGGGGGV